MRLVKFLLARCLLFCFPLIANVRAADIEFNRDVRPILSNHCFTCHGPDSATREADLRLDQRKAATTRTKWGFPAIVPGNPEHSEMLRRITSHDDDLRMPPAGGPKPLSKSQIATLTEWIKQGAEYQPHWAFVAPKAVPVPNLPPLFPDGGVHQTTWPQNEIDAFVGAKLIERGQRPARPATRTTLIRRVAFDLTGLPPTLQEVETFENDTSPDAYQKMVEHFLDAPAYGEHMARHWLDLARYADTNGYQYDTERQQWVWRDWVIDAYNRNMPFDQFTVEQLAGDLLPDSTPQQRLATGFNRNHGITIEGGIISEEYRTEYVMDRLVTTGEVWMGLTVGCARCHDHKYDPLSQTEFYQLYSFFNQVPERGNSGFDPREQISSPLAVEQHKELNDQLQQLEKQLADPLNIEEHLTRWTMSLAQSKTSGWNVLTPLEMSSSGGSTMTRLDDHSIVVGGANPRQDIYTITAETQARDLTAVRLEALTHPSLPANGPGRHSNSNFVLSEFELTATSLRQPEQTQVVRFVRAVADYSQKSYEVAKTIDGTVASNNGWAVDGPTRKAPATAMMIAEQPFGFEGGTRLTFRLRHEANFATHGIGRPRLSVSMDQPDRLSLQGVPADIRRIAIMPADRRSEADHSRLTKYFLANHDPRKALHERVNAIRQQLTAAFPATMIMRDMPQPRKTFVLNRGQYDEPTEEVSPGVPAVFPAMSADLPANRLGFAKWLTDPQHPLTARVAVNRYWQRLFGIGLVKTSEDFGVQGELPSHPELLDWLATEFIRSGWNVKHMHRLMLTSATYRQTSHVGAEQFRTDPDNRWLARGPRMRLDAEEIRDAALFASGLLQQHVGGRSVYPYQPAGLWMELNNRPGYSKKYPQGTGAALYRRSLYTFWKRTVPSPMLKTFDAPEREFCTVRRSRTNTPLQALLLMNGPQFVEAARGLAVRMLTPDQLSDQQRLQLGFRTLTARFASPQELNVLHDAYTDELRRCTDDADYVDRLLSVGEAAVPDGMDRIQLAAMASVARLMLNLNETITRG